MINKIAFIDDDSNVLEALKWIFRDEPSYNLHLFQKPLDALIKIREEEFAVVVCDQLMPDMEGTELLKLIKEKWPLTECFIITGQPKLDVLRTTDFPIVVNLGMLRN